ncbi:hypothetical protein KJ605_00100 [Patescibacteria group bacterium]|nr:hypothetical protein [Patescibacteria group bacterium]MBU1970172.1 hypothetical protein [Patescibacteria group bacterium]
MSKVVISLSVILFVLVLVAGYLASTVSLNNKTINRLIKEKTDMTLQLGECLLSNDNETKLDACLSKAEKDGFSLWLVNCDISGSNIEKDASGKITTCSLPSDKADKINAGIQIEKDNCFRRYSK